MLEIMGCVLMFILLVVCMCYVLSLDICYCFGCTPSTAMHFFILNFLKRWEGGGGVGWGWGCGWGGRGGEVSE